jgi:hypothetical protein
MSDVPVDLYIAAYSDPGAAQGAARSRTTPCSDGSTGLVATRTWSSITPRA